MLDRDSISTGPAAIGSRIDALQQSRPGITFRQTGTQPLANGAVRVQWQLQSQGKTATGEDTLFLRDGKITEAIRFQ